MNAGRTEPSRPSQELHYRQTPVGEFVFVRSVYTPANGEAVRATAGEFDDDVGFKATQICLLNLKLQIEGHGPDESDSQYRVLSGEIAKPFAETIRGLFKGNTHGAAWYQRVFGAGPKFLQCQGVRDPSIVVIKTNGDRPREVIVKLSQGTGGSEETKERKNPELVRQIIQSLERQIWEQRAGKRRASAKGGSRETLMSDTKIAQDRAERAWGALEDYVRDLADQSTPWNRLYGIDRLNDDVWRSAETYAYFGLQAREYMRANYNFQKKTWDIVFSKPVLEAIQRAIGMAGRFLPNHHRQGHSLTAFDDWRHPQSTRAGKPKFEIVRILIWSKSRLVTREAFAVARLHKIYNIPLFYLEPSNVDHDAQDEYILFCRPEDTPDSPPEKLRGMAWDHSRRDWNRVGDLSYHPLGHFFTLLKHPKLVFAIDAMEMLKRGTWADFEAIDFGDAGE